MKSILSFYKFLELKFVLAEKIEFYYFCIHTVGVESDGAA